MAVTVEAEIDEVWDVVLDVIRVGEWSHECVGAEWLDGSASPVPGARFRGRNRVGIFRWGRVCEIVSAELYELVWRTVPTSMYPDSSEGRITLAKIDGSTRISQRSVYCAHPRCSLCSTPWSSPPTAIAPPR